MDFYFTDRKFNLLGIASTGSEAPLTFFEEEDTESIKNAARMLTGTIEFKPEDTERVKRMAALGNYVLYQDENEKSVFSTIMDFEHNPKDRSHYIVTEDAGMDLINGLVGPYQADKAYTFADYFKRFAGNSGFEIGINEISNLSRTLKWESDEQTILERLISVATQFDNAEIDFSFTISGTQVITRYLNVYKRRGSNNRITLYMNKDINNIITKGNIYDLCTAVEGIGGDIDGKPVTLKGYNYTDPNGRFVLDKVTGVMKDTESVKIWSRMISNVNTEPTTGYIERRKNYETTNQKTLCDNVIRELERSSQPAINYETDISKLPKNVRIGDTVYLADENEELFLSARVLELTRIYSQDDYKAVLGDYLIEDDGLSQSLLELQEKLKQETTYLWIMYADDENGTGISPNPNGKKYIAIKQVKGVPNPSTNPEDYRGLWVQYVGGQGIQGPQGPDGKPRYTWIMYADDERGNGISTSPTGKWFLGTASDKLEPTPSTDPSEYKWQLVKGEDGQSSKVYTAYSWSADGKDRFTIPYPNENLIVRTGELNGKIISSDGSVGALAGQSLSSHEILITNEKIITLTQTIKDSTKDNTFRIGYYDNLGTFIKRDTPAQVPKVTLTAPQNTKSVKISYNTDNEVKLELGTEPTIYTPSPLDDFENAWPTFIGTYTTFDDVQSTNPEDYTWARMLGPQGEHGEDGAIGPQGPQGPDGPEGNGIKDTIIAYAASTSGTTAPTTGWQVNPPVVAANSFLWTRVTLRYTSGTDVHSYSVGKMGAQGPQGDKGATGGQGPQGPTGNGVASASVTYAASTSGTTAPTSGWVASPPAVAANSFLWTRVILTYTNGTSTTSYSVGKMGAQGPTGAQGPQGPQGNQGPQGPQGINGVAYAQPTQPSTTQEGAQWFKTISTTDLTVVEVLTYKSGAWKKTPFAAGALNVATISAISANLGNITAGNIKGVSIEGSEFLNAFENVNVDGGPDIAPVGAKAKGVSKISRGIFSSEGTIDTTHTFKTEYSPVYVSSVVYRNGVAEAEKIYNLTHKGLLLMDGGIGGTLRNQDVVTYPRTALTAATNFKQYSASGANLPTAERVGRSVQLSGAFGNTMQLVSNFNEIHMGTLPRWAWPRSKLYVIAHGSGANYYLLTVDTDGKLYTSRYNNGGSFTPYAVNTWLNISTMYAAADM